MTTPPTSHATGSTPDDPIELRGAQQRIRDAYLNKDSGLFVMSAVPGAGKSVVVTDVAARTVLRRYVNGDQTPEQSLTVVSFNASEAEQLAPDIVRRIHDLVDHGLTPAANHVNTDDIAYLTQRIRYCDNIGTIDSVLRGVLADIAGDLGFDTIPEVGNELQLSHIHEETYATIESESGLTHALDIVEEAYPPGTYDDGPRELLETAVNAMRAHQQTPQEITDALHETIDAVYEEGATASFRDITDAVTRCAGAEAALDACLGLDDNEKETLVTTDQELHEAWREAVDAFGSLLEAYEREYRRHIRDKGVISHTDAAYLVAGYLDGSLDVDVDKPKCERVLARHRRHFESVIVDEAQDVSMIQHRALSSLVTDSSRVFLAGDPRQSIYEWRDARPELFANAVNTGQYFGRDWTTHVTETTTTTYRARPNIASAINRVTAPALEDPDRGDLADFDMGVPLLDADRDSVDHPNVHVATVTTKASPGTRQYVEDESGEAARLASFVKSGLADGTLDTEATQDTDASPTVMVLFRWRTRMPDYRDAFEDEGLTVANASDHLFAAPAVRVVFAVLDWLAHGGTNQLQSLVRTRVLGIEDLEPQFSKHDWSLDSVLENETDDIPADQQAVLTQLCRLRNDYASLESNPPSRAVADIIDHLALRADLHDIFTDVDTTAAQRIANLDALVEHLAEWFNNEDSTTLPELSTLVNPFLENPYRGPTQPLPDTDDQDIIFQTIHQAKGDEADVIVLADPAFPVHKNGPTTQRLLTSPNVTALAPPTNVDDTGAALGPVRGLYDSTSADTRHRSTPHPRDNGLRWTTEHWHETGAGLTGHAHLQQAVRTHRAESWRLLYVALTRARDHLILPLPTEHDSQQSRDRWLDTVQHALDYTDEPTHGTYTIPSLPTDSLDTVRIGVNQANMLANHPTPDKTPYSIPYTQTVEIDTDSLPPFRPRYLSPSTLYPLMTHYDTNLLRYLLDEPIQTPATTATTNLSLTPNTVPADTIGTIVHDVLTTAIEQNLPKNAYQENNTALQTILNNTIQRHCNNVDHDERQQLNNFIHDTIIPDFLNSQTWHQIQTADEVYVETPLRAHIKQINTEYEIDGQADIILQQPNDTWNIIDLKTTLTTPTTQTRRQYQLQVTLYADLLQRQTQVSNPVNVAIQTLGAESSYLSGPYQVNSTCKNLDLLMAQTA